jgi:hypothetical protein
MYKNRIRQEQLNERHRELMMCGGTRSTLHGGTVEEENQLRHDIYGTEMEIEFLQAILNRPHNSNNRIVQINNQITRQRTILQELREQLQQLQERGRSETRQFYEDLFNPPAQTGSFLSDLRLQQGQQQQPQQLERQQPRQQSNIETQTDENEKDVDMVDAETQYEQSISGPPNKKITQNVRNIIHTAANTLQQVLEQLIRDLPVDFEEMMFFDIPLHNIRHEEPHEYDIFGNLNRNYEEATRNFQTKLSKNEKDHKNYKKIVETIRTFYKYLKYNKNSFFQFLNEIQTNPETIFDSNNSRILDFMRDLYNQANQIYQSLSEEINSNNLYFNENGRMLSIFAPLQHQFQLIDAQIKIILDNIDSMYGTGRFYAGFRKKRRVYKY